MPEQLLVRDVMRIGVPTCKNTDPVEVVAVQMLAEDVTALAVLDEDGDTVGWINERMLANAYWGVASGDGQARTTSEQVPECPVELPLSYAVQMMADQDVDHLIFLHSAGGRAWPASVLSLRDAVRALAGPEYIKHQGAGAPRPSAMDLFRQRNSRPSK